MRSKICKVLGSASGLDLRFGEVFFTGIMSSIEAVPVGFSLVVSAQFVEMNYLQAGTAVVRALSASRYFYQSGRAEALSPEEIQRCLRMLNTIRSAAQTAFEVGPRTLRSEGYAGKPLAYREAVQRKIEGFFEGLRAKGVEELTADSFADLVDTRYDNCFVPLRGFMFTFSDGNRTWAQRHLDDAIKHAETGTVYTINL